MKKPDLHPWVPFGPIMPNHLIIPKTPIWVDLFVASGLLNSYMKFHQDWTKNEPKTKCPCLGIYLGQQSANNEQNCDNRKIDFMKKP